MLAVDVETVRAELFRQHRVRARDEVVLGTNGIIDPRFAKRRPSAPHQVARQIASFFQEEVAARSYEAFTLSA